MHRHPRRRSSAALLATLIVGLVLSLTTIGTAPAQAAAPASAPRGAAHATVHPGCGPGVSLRVAERCATTDPQSFSEGGCGFLQRCVYLNRTEQQYLLVGLKFVVQAALCAGGLGIGCVVAGTIVEVAAQYLVSRGGICPASKPKLRVQYIPWPQAEGCVA